MNIIRIVALTPEAEPKWNSFCAEQDEAWFWHTSTWVNYCKVSRFHVLAENCSFMIVDENDHILAIIPLLAEGRSDESGSFNEFTFSGGPCPLFVIDQNAGKKVRQATEQLIWNTIDQIASLHQIKRYWVRENTHYPAYFSKPTSQPRLARKGFLDTSLYSCVLPLVGGLEQLWAGMRKGHRAAIKKAEKAIKVQCYDKNTISEQKLEHFREIYFCISGKVTRPLETFNIMLDIIKKGEGLLFEALLDKQTVGFTFVILFKRYAYYFMACVDREYSKYCISHYIQWDIF
ncbi:MAG: hypothetical protein WA125_04260, partial [Desulfosporosinus sp.]